jgi:hypothetical protein
VGCGNRIITLDPRVPLKKKGLLYISNLDYGQFALVFSKSLPAAQVVFGLCSPELPEHGFPDGQTSIFLADAGCSTIAGATTSANAVTKAIAVNAIFVFIISAFYKLR